MILASVKKQLWFENGVSMGVRGTVNVNSALEIPELRVMAVFVRFVLTNNFVKSETIILS